MQGSWVIGGFGALFTSALLLVVLAAFDAAYATAPDDQAVAYQNAGVAAESRTLRIPLRR